MKNTVMEICKSCKHAVNLNLSGYNITADRKLYRGWWDKMCPCNMEDRFKSNECYQWLIDNIKGAKFLYVLTAFWGCNHTTYYVFEYEDGSYSFTEQTFAVT